MGHFQGRHEVLHRVEKSRWMQINDPCVVVYLCYGLLHHGKFAGASRRLLRLGIWADVS